ncbi:ATP-binding cassette, putative [Eimeria tenella]|uniref:ATP-binding cassette, putative n=1 Tax=Eimeria tenella TaxID=5802 RepID=U6KZU3_EIMTE|nr:ATP-binding cassette, putative [Eimeria tenella]CDJ41869.1 ATP-binding cassette, putative [Eimeria tenella]|eukprot:XP_013232619.1 ATP-binding cassette, putative [Eimeria tenella]
MRRFLLPGAPQISRLPPIPLPFSSRVKDTTYLHLSFPPRERRLLCFSSRLYVRPTDAHNSSFEKVSALRESVPFSSVRSNGERPQESEEVPSRSAGKGTKSTGKLHTGDSGAVAAERPRVSLFEFLAFLKDEKFRVAGIMFALLLSSGAQLLLPLAVGKLVDAVTETTGDQHEKQQQQQQPEVAQLQQQEDEQQDQRREDSFHRQSSVTEGSNKVAAATDTPSAPATTAAGEPPPVVGRGKPEIATATEPSWRGLTGVFEENLKTPGARLGICVALGTVGAVTSFTRLYLLESTIERVACRLRSTLFWRLLHQTTQHSQQQQLGSLVKHLSQDVVTASRILVDVSFGLRCLLTSVVGICLCWAATPLFFLMSLLLPIAAATAVLRLSARSVAKLQQQHSRALQVAFQRATVALNSRRQLRSLNGEAVEAKAFDMALEGVLGAAKKSAVAIGCRHAFVFAAGSSLLVHLVHSAASLVAQGLFPTPTSHYHCLFPSPVPLRAFAFPISPVKQPGLVYRTPYPIGYIAIVAFTMALSAITVGVLTGGQVMSLALYSAFVGSSIQGCVTAWSDISRSVAAAGDMLQLLLRSPSPLLTSPLDYQAELTRFKEALQQQKEQEATVTMPTAVGSARRKVPAVEFRDVWLSYPDRGGRWALKGLSFQVPPGSLVAVTGPSGSGKSSLGALLLRLFEPQRGNIYLEGLPIRAFDERFIRSLVIPVLQDSVLFSGKSLEAQILYGQLAQQELSGAEGPKLAVSSACDAACVSPFAAALPKGLQTPLGERGAVLSGGQRQRVCLAMALYRLECAQRALEGKKGSRVPCLLFLDEATSSLDADTERQVLLNLKKRLHLETCLFIVHRPGVLEISDHIMVLDDGRVIQFGPKEEVLRSPCLPLQWLVSGAIPSGSALITDAPVTATGE